jgi:signal transduction histidine kinase
MTSLKARLSLALAVSLIALLALQWVVVSVAINRLTEQQLVGRLAKDTESLLAALQLNAQGGLHLDPRRISPRYERPFSGHYYMILSGPMRETSRSLWDASFELTPLDPGELRTFHLSGPERQPLIVVAQGFRKHDSSVTIAVAEDRSALNAGLRRFQVLYGAASAIVLMTLLVVQGLIVRRGLRPLDDVRQSMEKLARGEGHRIEPAGLAEIAPLIAQLNRLLSTMGHRSRRSREALGNLAHALKTRLAVFGQLAERPELDTYPDLRAAVSNATDGIRRIIERELKRARVAGDAMPGQRVALRDELSLLVKTLTGLYADKLPAITWEVTPGLEFEGDREDLLELLGNLLDNACKWCRGRVFLAAAGNGHDITFLVEDDGPGCAEEKLAALTRRGFRADEAMPGDGLGLAIARDIVESYGGTLSFGQSAALGGLRVEVRLPRGGTTGQTQ